MVDKVFEAVLQTLCGLAFATKDEKSHHVDGTDAGVPSKHLLKVEFFELLDSGLGDATRQQLNKLISPAFIIGQHFANEKGHIGAHLSL